MYLDDFISIIASCPWLWWLGVGQGLRIPRRRAADRNNLLKVGTVLLVPILTWAGTYVAAVYGFKESVAIMRAEFIDYMKSNDEKQRQHDERIRFLEQRLMK